MTDLVGTQTPTMSNQKYCFCQKNYTGRFMVCCDGCHIWFHGEGVGVRKGQISESIKWFCYSCSQKVHEETILRLDMLEKKTQQLGEDLDKVVQPKTEMVEQSNNILSKDNLEIEEKRLIKSQLKELEEELARVCEANTNLKNENVKLMETIQTAEAKILSALADKSVLKSNLSKLKEEYAIACQFKAEMEKESNAETKKRKIIVVDNESVLKSELKQLEEKHVKVCEENETLKTQLLNLKKKKKKPSESNEESAMRGDQEALCSFYILEFKPIH